MGRLRHRSGGGGRLNLRRYLARQFARPSGPVGRLLIGPWLDRISRDMNRLVLEQLEFRPDDDVLEIGFGGGALLAAIAAATRGRVVGVDPSAAMVARAARRFRALGRVQVTRGDVQRLPLASASVDKAVSVNNIYFWTDPAAGMRELVRVVTPGGTLSIAFEPPQELRRWPGHRFGFRLYEEAEVRALMEASGFGRIRRAEGSGRRPERFLCLTGERLRGEAAA